MEQKHVFLGHHNFGLSLIIDNLYSNFGTDIEIEIIENMDPKVNSIYDYPFVLNENKLRKTDISFWQPSSDSSFYLSSVSPSSRSKIFEQFKEKFDLSLYKFPVSVHTSAVISLSSQILQGSYIGPLSIIAPFCEIGKFCFINRATSVGHHCQLADFVTLSAGVCIGSRTVFETGVNIGLGATIFDGVTIGEGSIIGAGSLVTKNIPAGVIAYGSPAKIIREIDA